MIGLYISSRPKLSSSYNMEHEDTNISMPTSVRPFRQLSHSAVAGTSRTLEDRIMGICDENRIKIAYYDQCRYASSDLNDNENEGVRSSVETSDDDGDGDGMLRPPILKFGCDTGVNDMVYNDWSIYHKKIIVFYLWIDNFYLLCIRLDSYYMMVNILQLIFMILIMMMVDLLVIIYFLGSRHIILYLICYERH